MAVDRRREPQRPDNALWLSVASVWELALEKSLGRLEIQPTLESFLESQRSALGFRIVPIRATDALTVEKLPFQHRDPFDRMLVARR